jgi:hypothetical protein
LFFFFLFFFFIVSETHLSYYQPPNLVNALWLVNI